MAAPAARRREWPRPTPAINADSQNGRAAARATGPYSGEFTAWDAEERKPGYNQEMITDLVIHALEAMFLVGLVGSAVVVIISFVEDAKELFGED